MTSSYSTRGTESYASIVEAIRADILRSSGAPAKDYEYNFKGITQALQALTIEAQSGPGSEISPQPSGGNVIINDQGDPEWIVSTQPADGTLWFDTRQGRLFIAYQNEWYQTNGGDGLATVTETTVAPSASNLPIGQFWWDREGSSLYIFSGTYEESDGSFVTVPTATTTPVWTKITLDQGDYFQNTKTLPVEGTSFQTAVDAAIANGTYIPSISSATLVNQQNVNAYQLDVSVALDAELKNQTISMGTSPPANPVEGQLWFDTSEIEISIFYNDGTRSQWVPVFSAIMYDEDILALSRLISTEKSSRQASVLNLEVTLEAMELADKVRDATVTSLQGQISNLPTYDLSSYVTNSAYTTAISNLQKVTKVT